MGHLIKNEMVVKFNQEMVKENSIIRLVDSMSGSVYIRFKEDNYIDDVNPILNDRFYKRLEEFFIKVCGLKEITYNNTKSTFWSIG